MEMEVYITDLPRSPPLGRLKLTGVFIDYQGLSDWERREDK